MTLICGTDCDICHPRRNSRPVPVEIKPLLVLPDDYGIQILYMTVPDARVRWDGAKSLIALKHGHFSLIK